MLKKVDLNNKPNKDLLKISNKRLRARIIRDQRNLAPVIKITFIDSDSKGPNFYLRRPNFDDFSQRFSNDELAQIYADCNLQVRTTPPNELPPSFKEIMKDLERVIRKRKIIFSLNST